MVSAKQVAHLIAKIRDPEKPFIVLVSGASGSGKTTEARKILSELDKLGTPLLRYQGQPFLVEMDMFYRDESKDQSDVLGGNYDHPAEIDVTGIEEFLDLVMEGREASVPVYDFSTGRRKGRKGPIIPDRNPVILVEGIYSMGLLSHRSNLNVFVEARSKMELLARRLIRDVERVGTDISKIVGYTLTAMAMWNIYGETQKKFADIILRSSYSVVEEKGEPSYQIKIPQDVFMEILPSTAKDLFGSKPIRVEDIVIGDEEERMRGRLYFDSILPSRFELSYRNLYPNELPYTKSLRIELPTEAYSAFVKLSQVMGYRPTVFFREIHFLNGDGVLFKWYPDRRIVEIETPLQEKISYYVERFRGNIRLQSYYRGAGF